MPQGGYIGRTFSRGIDQLLLQYANDAVFAGKHLADPVAILTGRFNHTTGRGVNDRGHAAGLCIENIFLHPDNLFLLPKKPR
jgi:hypothetical protein